MSRIRTVKPEFWQDEKLGPLPPLERLVFLGLISMADDGGRVVDSVKAIDGFVFALTDDTSRDALPRLADLGVITRGATTSGQPVIQIAGWERHQKIDKPNLKSALPPLAEMDRRQVVEASPKRRRRRADKSPRLRRSDLRSTTYDLRSTTVIPTTGDLPRAGARDTAPEPAHTNGNGAAAPRKAAPYEVIAAEREQKRAELESIAHIKGLVAQYGAGPQYVPGDKSAELWSQFTDGDRAVIKKFDGLPGVWAAE